MGTPRHLTIDTAPLMQRLYNTRHTLATLTKPAVVRTILEQLGMRAPPASCWSLQQIANALNAEGWRPARQCETFSRSMVRGLLPSNGTTPPQRSIMERVELGANEWTMQALAARLHMPRVTLHCWRKRGWVRARWVPIPRPVGAWILWADNEELERLAARRRPSRKRWPRRPQAA